MQLFCDKFDIAAVDDENRVVRHRFSLYLRVDDTQSKVDFLALNDTLNIVVKYYRTSTHCLNSSCFQRGASKSEFVLRLLVCSLADTVQANSGQCYLIVTIPSGRNFLTKTAPIHYRSEVFERA
jgi:hypothetical protein